MVAYIYVPSILSMPQFAPVDLSHLKFTLLNAYIFKATLLVSTLLRTVVISALSLIIILIVCTVSTNILLVLL